MNTSAARPANDGPVIRWLALAIGGALVLGCLSAPPLYSWIQSWSSPPDWPYSRVFDRAAMLSLLVMLVLLRRHLDLGGVKQAFRLGTWPDRSFAFFVGLVLSTALALAVVPLLVAGDKMVWSGMAAGTLALKLLEALPGAIAVSVIEESFFRVLILDGLTRRLRVAAAVLFCSAFYAAVHFIAPVKTFVYPGWSLGVGFDYMGQIFSRYTLPAVLAGMMGLLLIGIVLCWAIRRTRSIYLCIGLHAGWFFVAKAAVYLADVAEGAELPRGVNERYFLVGRPWTWLSIVLVGLAIWLLRERLTVRLGAPSLPSRAES